MSTWFYLYSLYHQSGRGCNWHIKKEILHILDQGTWRQTAVNTVQMSIITYTSVATHLTSITYHGHLKSPQQEYHLRPLVSCLSFLVCDVAVRKLKDSSWTSPTITVKYIVIILYWNILNILLLFHKKNLFRAFMVSRKVCVLFWSVSMLIIAELCRWSLFFRNY